MVTATGGTVRGAMVAGDGTTLGITAITAGMILGTIHGIMATMAGAIPITGGGYGGWHHAPVHHYAYGGHSGTRYGRGSVNHHGGRIGGGTSGVASGNRGFGHSRVSGYRGSSTSSSANRSGYRGVSRSSGSSRLAVPHAAVVHAAAVRSAAEARVVAVSAVAAVRAAAVVDRFNDA